MPGQASLEARQYYAYAQNQFWFILGGVCGFDATIPYRQRVAALLGAGIAVWDVLASCIRSGSGDADIDSRSIIVNNFSAFLKKHTRIERICFNGAIGRSDLESAGTKESANRAST